MRTSAWLSALLLFSANLLAHPGEEPVADPDDPWDDFECELPTETSSIDVSYHIWFVGQDVGETSDDFCSTVVGVQLGFESNDLHLRLYPTGEDSSACELIPQTTISDTGTVKDINQFAEDVHTGSATWDSVHEFVVEGSGASPAYFQSSAINIYVLHTSVLADFRGMHLRDIKAGAGQGLGGGNMIFVPSDTTDDTLSHEFAHAFSLEHVNFWSLPVRGGPEVSDNEKKQKLFCAEYDYWDGVCDFRRDNYMWAKGENRKFYSEGQKARMVCNDWSALNTNGDRGQDPEVFRCPGWSLMDLLGDDDTQRPCPRLHDGLYEPAE